MTDNTSAANHGVPGGFDALNAEDTSSALLDSHRQAAENGHADSQFRLGQLLCWVGGGNALDLPEAARFFGLAGSQGHTGAQYMLGWMYDSGYGIAVNRSEALRLYGLATDGGHPEARFGLAVLNFSGQGMPGGRANLRESRHLIREGALLGHAPSQFFHGLQLYDGDDGDEEREPDERAAALWCERSARQGYQHAIWVIAGLYANGIGVDRDCYTALWWYNRVRDRARQPSVAAIVEEMKISAQIFVVAPCVDKRAMIECGESVCGRSPDTGDTALHHAARNAEVCTIVHLFENPAFEALVVARNWDNKSAKDLLDEGPAPSSPLLRAMRSVISVSRVSRAACVVWCFLQADSASLWAHFTLDIIREIVSRGVCPPLPSIKLRIDHPERRGLLLLGSPSAWTEDEKFRIDACDCLLLPDKVAALIGDSLDATDDELCCETSKCDSDSSEDGPSPPPSPPPFWPRKRLQSQTELAGDALKSSFSSKSSPTKRRRR